MKLMVSFLFFARAEQISSSLASGNIARMLVVCGAPYPAWRRGRRVVFSQFIRIQTGYQQKAGMMDSLQMRIERRGELAVMYLSGRIDIESSPQLRDELLALLGKQLSPGTIIVDLAEVAYMDTSGVATLIEALKMARIGRIALHLQGLQGRLLRFFESTGIGWLFENGKSADNPSLVMVS